MISINENNLFLIILIVGVAIFLYRIRKVSKENLNKFQRIADQINLELVQT